eukprot:CAMPEP_0170099964 /NCGR_PEP_ID=MMETSP0020_2-20130122/1356_1 /TAXON_ID=98059 /ORGANISM="Dinobryon sp., Strain UTEXLB2267" /LENGTH=207 /DNA_ID=CAMNT_0010322729 /DNA_START=24 /DNA_END=647 /DNA_ORIENTATION=+
MKASFTIHDENENVVINKKSGLFSKGVSNEFGAQSNNKSSMGKLKVVKSERKALSNLSGSQINTRHENPNAKKIALMKPTVFQNMKILSSSTEVSENPNKIKKATTVKSSNDVDIDTEEFHCTRLGTSPQDPFDLVIEKASQIRHRFLPNIETDDQFAVDNCTSALTELISAAENEYIAIESTPLMIPSRSEAYAELQNEIDSLDAI